MEQDLMRARVAEIRGLMAGSSTSWTINTSRRRPALRRRRTR